MSFFIGEPNPRDVSRNTPARRSRSPVQERSQERITRALTAAEKLLIDVGPEGTSIPEIATAAGVPRSSIYPYFPDKLALFAHLAEVHMARMMNHIVSAHPHQQDVDWRAFTRDIIKTSAAYYNEHPIASILLLQGPFATADRAAQSVKDSDLAQWFRGQVQRAGRLLALPETPDAAALAVELAFACLKYGYNREGHISDQICNHAAMAAIGYLAEWD